MVHREVRYGSSEDPVDHDTLPVLRQFSVSIVNRICCPAWTL
jgi:hypothetical protein